MRPHITFGQLTLLVGTAVAIGGLLVFIVYGLRKALRAGRRGEAEPQAPRASDSSTFALATMQGVIAKLKEEQRRSENERLKVKRAAEMNARLLEILASAVNEALVVFTCEGYIHLINPAARGLLGADSWSRRRYDEILAPESALAILIRACLETGETAKGKCIEVVSQSGKRCSLLACVLPWQVPAGNIEGAICLLRETRESTASDTKKTE